MKNPKFTFIDLFAGIGGKARRRSDCEFARAEARRKRRIREEVERELQEKFHIPIKIRRMASADNDL